MKARRKSWVRIPVGSTFVMLAVVACSSQSPQPQNQNVVNGTQADVAVPSGTPATSAPAISGPQGNIYEAEQLTPEQLVQQYGDLLHNRRFADAFALWGPNPAGMTEKQFESRFDQYKTIDAAVGKVGPTEGAAGSIYSTVQLTLSGNKKDGTPYVITGPVTLRRVNDVPGSTAEQRRWHIEKVDLTADPKAAESKLKG
ncbi:MAG: hypothetical protein ACTHN4_04125 [Sphingomicrobium sp.]